VTIVAKGKAEGGDGTGVEQIGRDKKEGEKKRKGINSEDVTERVSAFYAAYRDVCFRYLTDATPA